MVQSLYAADSTIPERQMMMMMMMMMMMTMIYSLTEAQKHDRCPVFLTFPKFYPYQREGMAHRNTHSGTSHEPETFSTKSSSLILHLTGS
jgi:hypothetical protein